MWGGSKFGNPLLSKRKGHFQLPHPPATGTGFVPLTPSLSGGGGQQVPQPLQQQYILPQAIDIINTVPYRGWAHITADFTGFFSSAPTRLGFSCPCILPSSKELRQIVRYCQFCCSLMPPGSRVQGPGSPPFTRGDTDGSRCCRERGSSGRSKTSSKERPQQGEPDSTAVPGGIKL